MNHTPGPWRTLHSCDELAGIDGKRDIAIVAGGIIAEAFYRIDDNKYADVEANARLIAAAPELLEALREIMECPYAIDQATVPKAGIDTAPEQVVGMMSMALLKYRKARQAIAKAEGKYENEIQTD